MSSRVSRGHGGAELFGDDEQDAAGHQGIHHGFRPEQIGLDPAVDSQPDDHGGQHAEDDVHQGEGRVARGRFLTEVNADESEQAAPEHDDHCQDGAELDHHLEGGGLGSFKPEEVADDDHVAGGGDGEELGQAFHYAQHKGDEQGVEIRSWCRSLGYGVWIKSTPNGSGRPMMAENRAGNR